MGDVRVMLPSEAVSQTAGFNLLPHVTVSVAGIEPAAPSFQARMSTNDLHAGDRTRAGSTRVDGQSGWNRTSIALLPKQVDGLLHRGMLPRARWSESSGTPPPTFGAPAPKAPTLWRTPAESNRAVPGFNRMQSPDLPDVRVSCLAAVSIRVLRLERPST